MELYEELCDDLLAGNVVIVVGAGVSIEASDGARTASWRGLLEDGIDRACAITPSKADRLREWAALSMADGGPELFSMVAQRITTEMGGRDGGEFQAWMDSAIGELSAVKPEIVFALGDLKSPIMTTNYDSIISSTLGREYCTWQDDNFANKVIRGDSDDVLHIHGHWRFRNSIVLGLQSYDDLQNYPPAAALREAVGSTRSMLLVGFGAGLEDPTFHALRQFLRVACSGNAKGHYLLTVQSESDGATQILREERIRPLRYGTAYSDLTPFLVQLSRDTFEADEVPGEAPSPLEVQRIPQKRWAMQPPRLPYSKRPEVDSELNGLLRNGTPVVSIGGISGSGKSHSVAHAVRSSTRETFWYSPREGATLNELLLDLNAAGFGLPKATSQRVKCEALVGHLTEQSSLLVIDDICDTSIEEFELLVDTARSTQSNHGAVLALVGRDFISWTAPGSIDRYTVRGFTPEDALELFSQQEGVSERLKLVLPDLVEAIDGHALGLEIFSTLVEQYGLEPDELLAGALGREARVSGWLDLLLSKIPGPGRHLLEQLAFTTTPFDESVPKILSKTAGEPAWWSLLNPLLDRYVVERSTDRLFRVHSFVARVVRQSTLQEDATEIHRQLAAVYLKSVSKRKRRVDSEEEFRAALLRTHHLHSSGDLEKAHRALQSSIKYGKNSGNYSMLIQALRAHRDVNPDRSSWIDYDLAHSYLIQGQFDSAIEVVEDLPRPREVPLRLSIARIHAEILLETGSAEAACNLLRPAISNYRQRLTSTKLGHVPLQQALTTLARALASSGRTEEAQKCLNEAESTMGDDEFARAILTANRVLLDPTMSRAAAKLGLEDALRVFEKNGDRRGRCWIQSHLARLFLKSPELDDRVAGARLLDAALSEKEALGECSLDYENLCRELVGVDLPGALPDRLQAEIVRVGTLRQQAVKR